MLGWEFPPFNRGGLGVACKGLAEALCSRDVEVLFVLPKRLSLKHDTIRLLFAEGGHFSVRHVDTALVPYITTTEYERYRKDEASPLYGSDLIAEVHRYGKAVRAIAESETFDVIHAHDWLSYLAGIEAKRVSGKPLILHVHATSFDQSGGNGVDPRVYAIEQEGFKNADAIITVSNYTRRLVERHYNVAMEKVHVVYNGVDAKIHEGYKGDILSLKKDGNKIVLFVGRLTLHKGPDYFLRAASRVLKYLPNVYFVISGSGEMENQLVREAVALGIADRVFFAGFVRGNDLDRLYRAADLYILPSVSEPFGLTPLESLINGTPVMVSKQSGVSEVVKNALKVDFWDVDEMANQIISVLQNEPLKKQLAELGRDEVYHLTWQRAAEQCASLYRKIVNALESAISRV